MQAKGGSDVGQSNSCGQKMALGSVLQLPTYQITRLPNCMCSQFPPVLDATVLRRHLQAAGKGVLYFALPTHVEGCSPAIRHPVRRAVAHCPMPCPARN